MKTRTIDPDVRAVLERAFTWERTLQIREKLDRALYVKVNKTLADLGGKWVRIEKRHVFPVDARGAVTEALAAGETVNEQQSLQAFFTPFGLAAEIAELADVKDHVVLEPSAGEGALASACMAAGAASVVCVEPYLRFAAVLREKGFKTYDCNFLVFDIELMQSGTAWEFTRIVMNPPFTRNADVLHVMHALDLLAPGGKLVAIMAGNEERSLFRALLGDLDQRGWDYYIHKLPEGSFKASGTNVRTIALDVHRA